MRVPFLDLRAAYLELQTELDGAVKRVLDSGWYLLGDELAAFEHEYATYCEAAHCVGVGSGLDALRLALKACGVERGDEVIVPSFTFIATWLAVTEVGAYPIAVDVEEISNNMDVDKLESAISSKTRAIVPVHLYGQPADLTSILDVARARGIRVVEDAAQAHGAIYQGRRIGSHGDAVAWSFYPGKNLGAFGDGGAVTTNDPDIASRLRLLRNYGSMQKYVHECAGINSRLDELQAAVLRVKLRALEEWNARRRAVAARYSDAFHETRLTLPLQRNDVQSVWHLYVVRTDNRDNLKADLGKSGVTTQIHYPLPPHRQKAFEHTRVIPQQTAVAEKLAAQVLSLPIGPHVTDAMVNHVIESVLGQAR